ncbi:MAG: cobalamin biosynthesis protein [Christensenellales bacterium]
MNILYAMLGGFALDWLFGDPAWLTHPVVIMGKAISALERALRARLPKTPRGERLGGLTLAIVLPVGTLLLTGGVCRVLGAVHPLLGFAVELLWCAQALAATAAWRRTSTASWKADDLPAARSGSALWPDRKLTPRA